MTSHTMTSLTWYNLFLTPLSMATQKSNKKKKVCPIDEAGITQIDYKDTAFLKKFLTKFNRIIPRYYSGTTLRNQKKLAVAVKRARYMVLLPYVLEVTRPSGVAVAPTHTTLISVQALIKYLLFGQSRYFFLTKACVPVIMPLSFIIY